MAFQVGTFNISGTLGSITFYKRNGKYFARARTSLNKDRIKTDPAFAKFRACSTVFGRASSMASVIYQRLKPNQKRKVCIGKLTGKINGMLRESKSVYSIFVYFFRIYKIKRSVSQSVVKSPFYSEAAKADVLQVSFNSGIPFKNSIIQRIKSIPLLMNTEEIQKFLDKKTNENDHYIKIDFKKRDSIYGLFIQDKDYSELKSKNFWRIVTQTHFDEYNKSKNVNLAKIFNGSEFSRLTLYKDSF
jgi:hypothetical protein